MEIFHNFPANKRRTLLEIVCNTPTTHAIKSTSWAKFVNAATPTQRLLDNCTTYVKLSERAHCTAKT